MSAAHEHTPVRWVMGEHPVCAHCACGYKLIANGGGWVSPERAAELRRKVGIRGTL